MGYIPVNEPLLNGNEKKYLAECIDTGWISSEGPFVTSLEEGLAAYVGRKHGIVVCNGSVALDLVVEALQLEEGDEVIMPTFTIISCAAALIRKKIKPVLIDSEPDTWNMDTSKIEEKITSKTRAIMVVHLYGLPVEMKKVTELAEKYGLLIIEDGAEAHGLEYSGKKCGSFGTISAMSFYPNKHITTGEGGIVLTDDDKLAERCRSFRNLCHKPGHRFVHEELGYNFRMSNIQAAVGVAQLEQLEQHLELKRKMGSFYQSALQGCRNLQLPVAKTEEAYNLYWVFGLVISAESNWKAREAMQYLNGQGIGCRPFFYPMHLQPVFQKMHLFEGEKYPVAEWLAEKGFYIPSGLTLDEQQMSYVSEKVLELDAILVSA